MRATSSLAVQHRYIVGSVRLIIIPRTDLSEKKTKERALISNPLLQPSRATLERGGRGKRAFVHTREGFVPASYSDGQLL